MKIKYFKTCLLSASIFSFMAVTLQTVEASPVYRNTHHTKQVKHAKNPYRIGSHHRSLPRGYKILWISGQRYFHYNHVYYRKVNNAYIVVEEPTNVTISPLYIYPALGQSDEQQRQDRYECHVWASNQTGFDPSNIASNTTTQVVYAEQPQTQHNNDVLTGAVGGAAVGALGGAIAGDPGIGAAVGAGAGAITGAITQNQRQHQVSQTVTTNTTVNQGKENYDRAITACLEARNYTVK